VSLTRAEVTERREAALPTPLPVQRASIHGTRSHQIQFYLVHRHEKITWTWPKGTYPFCVEPGVGGKDSCSTVGSIARRLPPKKAARYRDKAKPLVCCANGFAVNVPSAWMPGRRFLPPWSVDEQDACFVVRGLRKSFEKGLIWPIYGLHWVVECIAVHEIIQSQLI
jgi:hypothetical protein